MKKMMAGLLLLLLLPFSAAASQTDPLAGRSGEALLRAVRWNFRPACLPSATLSYLLQIDRAETSIRSLLRGSDLPARDIDNITASPLCQRLWWAMGATVGDTVYHDLHNCTLAPSDETGAIAERCPWELPGESDMVLTGEGRLADAVFGAFCPPASRRGDWARTILYMITLYHADWWHVSVRPILNRGVWPYFSDVGIALLLKWHREDPPDECERVRSARIAALQGSGNPFVDRPELAEYIWGDKSSDPLPPQDSDDPSEPVPTNLRGTYHSADSYIWLRSPHVPADAVWSIDGSPVSPEYIPVDMLPQGLHQLRFSTSSGITGILTISVLP